MYSDLRDYITYELYPALYERLGDDGVFNEFAFRLKGSKYQSTTANKITGRVGNTKGQVYVYASNPGRMFDHSEGSVDFLEYQQTTHNMDFMQALRSLSEMARISPYKANITPEQLEAVRRAQSEAKAWEEAVNYCLTSIHNPAHKEEAQPVVDYLTSQRHYTALDIQHMQIGYVPSRKGLYEHLKGAGLSDEQIAGVNLSEAVGRTHKIAIPIRDARGRAVGMAFRTADRDTEPKYIYSTGLRKGEGLFNLYTKARNGAVVLVEGQLDAGVTEVRGYTMATVAAIGGKSITSKQISHLQRAGTREVFVCLDNEPGTEEDVRKTVDALSELEQLEDRIYIVQLPDGVKDVDQLVTTQGIEAFDAAVKGAQAHYMHYASKRLSKYAQEVERNGYSDKALNDVTDDIVRIAAKVSSPLRHEELKRLSYEFLKQTGIQADSDVFMAAIDRIRYREDEQKQAEQLKSLLKKSERLREDGKVKDAIDTLEGSLRDIKLRDRRTEFEQLEATRHTEDGVRERIRLQPDGVKTGYQVMIQNHAEDILIPAGQLTFVAAPSGHGKSTFLINVALNVLKGYPKKEVYLFTFEQSADEVLLYFLNTYIGENLNRGNNNNRRTLLDYYKGKNFISQDIESHFEVAKANFYKDIAPRLRIINVEYSADELIQYIEFIRKRTSDVLICIDYIQKLRSDRKGKIDGRFTELKFICEDLQAAALPARTGLPFLLAAQFNRDVVTPLDMQITRIAEASDIEKIASEVLGLWNCTKKLGRKVDKNEAKELFEVYGINPHVFAPEPNVVLEVLKSRSMSTGHIVKLDYNANTGVLSGANAKRPGEGRYY